MQTFVNLRFRHFVLLLILILVIAWRFHWIPEWITSGWHVRR